MKGLPRQALWTQGHHFPICVSTTFLVPTPFTQYAEPETGSDCDLKGCEKGRV